MASNRLDPNDFGLKLYSRFPLSYRVDDIDQKYSLRRYLEAAADGGFKYIIEEQNGLLDLINPQTSPLQVIYLLYEQYGLDLFHGIPEEFLRAFLPNLGFAWSKKGSLDVIEYIVSSLSGIKTSTEVTFDDFDNPVVRVRLEMDYSVSDYFPDTKQFERILQHFIPFYCDALLIYSYVYYEYGNIHADEYMSTFIWDKNSAETGSIPYGIHWVLTPLLNTDKMLNFNFILNDYYGHGCEEIPLLNTDKMLNQNFILNQDIKIYKEYDTDSFVDKLIYYLYEDGFIVNTGTRDIGGTIPLLNTDNELNHNFILDGDVFKLPSKPLRPVLNMMDRSLNVDFMLNEDVDTEEHFDNIFMLPVTEQPDILGEDKRTEKIEWNLDDSGNILQEEKRLDKVICVQKDEIGITNKRIIGGTPMLNNMDIQLNVNFILNDGVFHSAYIEDIYTYHLNTDISLNVGFILNDGIIFPLEGVINPLLNAGSYSLNDDFTLNDRVDESAGNEYAGMEEYFDKILYKDKNESVDLSGTDTLYESVLQKYDENAGIESNDEDVCVDNFKYVAEDLGSIDSPDTCAFINTEYGRLNDNFILSPNVLSDKIIVSGVLLNDNFVMNSRFYNETTEIIGVLSPIV